MSPSHSVERGHDPCLQIQVDLSAMVDGELDPAGVRRVMVHSDVCCSCRQFLEGIRSQIRLHRRLAPVLAAGDAPEASHSRSAKLRRQLTRNRRKLSRVLYELGRGFVLMGLSPDFSREVAKEPVPVPDLLMRGRNLLDEVARHGAGLGGASEGGASEGGACEGGAADWVAARDLFDGQLRSADENLAKGQRFLTECLALEDGCDEARIYLGLLHYVRGQRALARKEYQQVLAHSTDRSVCAYALSNLANIHLDEGDCDTAIDLLLRLVNSGVLQDQPRMATAYFNLALAYGQKQQFGDCLRWFLRLDQSLPHKRNMVAREISRRSQFVHLVRTHPEGAPLMAAFPAWFPPRSVDARAGAVG